MFGSSRTRGGGIVKVINAVNHFRGFSRRAPQFCYLLLSFPLLDDRWYSTSSAQLHAQVAANLDYGWHIGVGFHGTLQSGS